MELIGFLTLLQIAIVLTIGLFFGSLITFFWNYRDIKKTENYIHKLEQTLNDNKIWIES